MNNSFFNPPDKLSQLRKEKCDESETTDDLLKKKMFALYRSSIPCVALEASSAALLQALPTLVASSAALLQAHPTNATPTQPPCKIKIKKIITRCKTCKVVTKGFYRCFDCNEKYKN
jgi:hypothetical protein